MTAPSARTDGALAVGVDVGGTKVLSGVVDGAWEVRWSEERPTVTDSEEGLLAQIEMQVEAALEAAAGPVAAIGLGIPATIDRRTGVAIFAPNAPLDHAPVRERFEARFGLPVTVDNDANAAVWAEHVAGAARGVDDVVALTLGTGVGGGVILDGRLLRGATGAAGELGHMVVALDGPDCPGGCPGKGCLEAVASGTALGLIARVEARRAPHGALGRRAATLGGPDAVTSRDVVELAMDGDDAASALVRELGRRVGYACVGLVNVFDPAVIVLGGGLASAAGDLILAPVREVIAARALPPGRDTVRVVAARFGAEAGMVGAGALALDALR